MLETTIPQEGRLRLVALIKAYRGGDRQTGSEDRNPAPVTRSAVCSNRSGRSPPFCLILRTMCHIPMPETTSTNESSPKPKRAILSSSRPKKTETSPSAML